MNPLTINLSSKKERILLELSFFYLELVLFTAITATVFWL